MFEELDALGGFKSRHFRRYRDFRWCFKCVFVASLRGSAHMVPGAFLEVVSLAGQPPPHVPQTPDNTAGQDRHNYNPSFPRH